MEVPGSVHKQDTSINSMVLIKDPERCGATTIMSENCITKTCPCKYTENFSPVKTENFQWKIFDIFSSPEPKAHKVSLWYRSRAGVRPCVRASVHVFKLKYL